MYACWHVHVVVFGCHLHYKLKQETAIFCFGCTCFAVATTENNATDVRKYHLFGCRLLEQIAGSTATFHRLLVHNWKKLLPTIGGRPPVSKCIDFCFVPKYELVTFKCGINTGNQKFCHLEHFHKTIYFQLLD